MGTKPFLASSSRIVLLMLLIIFASRPAFTADYYPNRWFFSAGASLDVINPDEFNQALDNAVPLQFAFGLGRLKVERGLFAPNWSHWIEFSSHSATTTGNNTGATLEISQSLSHISIIPLGVTYWFKKTAFLDYGLSLGLGFGLSPEIVVKQTPIGAGIGSQTASETQWKGDLSFLGSARLSGRFWIGRNWALTTAGALRLYSVPMTNSAGESRTANLTSLNLIVAATYALGGSKGTGRKFVEVLPGQKRKKRRRKRRKKKRRRVKNTF